MCKNVQKYSPSPMPSSYIYSPPQCMNCELPDVQVGFRKGRGTIDQIANICWIIKKAREFQKNIYFCFVDYAKAFDSVDHNKLWKILKEMGVPDHLNCLLRNLYAGQEATVRTGHGTTDWFQIGKSTSSCIDARYWMTGAGALGRPRGMEWGGRREEGSGWGTHVYLWWIHFDIWQN